MADLALAGFANSSDTLLSGLATHVSYLERCSHEAEAVLRGDLRAATRLWLLLRDPINAGPVMTPSVSHEIVDGRRSAPPRVINAERLVRLLEGVVRAANQPSEAEAMLDSLGRLLEPLSILELTASALERAGRGDVQRIETLVTAQSAPKWRATVTGAGNVADSTQSPTIEKPFLKPIDSGGELELEWDRVPYEIATWRDGLTSTTLDRWDLCGTAKSMGVVDKFGPRYKIESISNPGACAGET